MIGYKPKPGETIIPPEWLCRAKRRNGKKCRKPALKGSHYCQLHGGRSRGKTVKVAHMPRFYSKHLTKSLSDALEDLTSVSPNEQLSLFEELALVRDAAGQAVAMYSICKEAYEQEPSPKRGEILAAATMEMRGALDHVVKVCEAAARIDSQAKDKVSIHTLHFFIQQITRIAYDAFDDDPRARAFEELLRTRIKLPQAGADGTVLTPDMDVQTMDSTVPQCTS
jgi:hypothetical protein